MWSIWCTFFLIEEEWKDTAEIDAVLYRASRLTTIFQNEEKLNSAHAHVMRNIIHDGSSSGSLEAINAETWSKN